MAEVLSGRAVFSTSVSSRRRRPIIAGIARSSIDPVRYSSSRRSGFLGTRLVLEGQYGRIANMKLSVVPFKMALLVGKATRWWEKGVQPNMKKITSAQDLVDSLSKAGDKLVVVDFFSPGCGGCKALHPKICQIAENNHDVLFLQVNYEEHKSMSYSLNVHVLPFFRFYRGAHGRLCSFSCTNATIKKFKDALAKHNTARCSLGPAKGLEESELMSLSANRDLSFNYSKKEEPAFTAHEACEPDSSIRDLSLSEKRAVATSGR